jgi:ectoine hydroxylase-related dioxygenase (phytanoyl-CoA dioxygenase family)
LSEALAITSKRADMNQNSDVARLDEAYEVHAEHVAAFQQNGFLQLREVASRAAIDAYRPDILATAESQLNQVTPLAERDTLGKAFVQIWHLCEQNERVREFVMAKRFARIAADIMGVDSVRLYHDQILFKEPGGGATPWHQDQFYIPLDTTKVLTMWMPLVDVAPEMGTMDFIPGSHAEGPLAWVATSENSDDIFQNIIDDRQWPVVPGGAMRAGDASFHTGWTVHRAQANTSEKMREVITILYYADGAKLKPELCDFEQHISNLHISGTRAGAVADGWMNPVVFRR